MLCGYLLLHISCCDQPVAGWDDVDSNPASLGKRPQHAQCLRVDAAGNCNPVANLNLLEYLCRKKLAGQSFPKIQLM